DFSSGDPGRRANLRRTEPEQPDLTFHNEVRAGAVGSGDNAYIFGVPHTFQRYVRGTIPPNRKLFSIKGSMGDPALTAARLLTEALQTCGIEVNGSAISGHGAEQMGVNLINTGTRFHTHRSPVLSEIVHETNMESVNLYAEALAVHVAKALKQPFRGGEAAGAVVRHWRNKGVKTSGMYVRDGSGLSPNNVMSPAQMTAILAAARKGSAYKAFEASLPLAGRSGSLRKMLKGTVAEGRLRAKSGYISGVRAYTGYVRTPEGRELCFAMMANHHGGGSGAMRRRFEELMAKIAEGK
ncbi:MAG: D-alanyl-D-alanine carboxypeptidase/D-alanyl-D-alanine-endopeptidase, partial [Bacteroidota bacterium]